jgi:hypothetical protein
MPGTTAAQQRRENPPDTATLRWQTLQKGMQLGIFRSPQPAGSGNSLIRIVRIDPAGFKFNLLMASADNNGKALTVKQWCRQNNLVAGINASMYQTDYKTSVSLMRTKAHINNPRLSKDKTILAFDRVRPDVPWVKMIDRQCEDFGFWRKKYGSLIQSIRMISCKGKNVWRQQAKKWSTAAIAIDNQRKVLFIHVGALYSTHDLINILKQIPLGISRAMYCEGGPQAQLYVRSKDREYEFVGGFELNANETLGSPVSWPIPNIVGISARK